MYVTFTLHPFPMNDGCLIFLIKLLYVWKTRTEKKEEEKKKGGSRTASLACFRDHVLLQ